MKVLLGSDKIGLSLKNEIKEYLQQLGFNVIDKTPNGSSDFIDSTILVTNAIKNNEGDVAILFDGFGVGSFMCANKIKGIIAACVSDERSAKMTRDHNNTKIITLGSEIVGASLAKNCVVEFLNSKYSGGRHQIRVDMLNKMM